MNLANHKKTSGCLFGPGGLRCSCCNPFRSIKLAKRKANRYVRRTAKISLDF